MNNQKGPAPIMSTKIYEQLQIHSGQRQTFVILCFSKVPGMNPAVLLPDSGAQPTAFCQAAGIMVQHSLCKVCVRFSACCQLPVQGEKYRMSEIPDADTNIRGIKLAR